MKYLKKMLLASFLLIFIIMGAVNASDDSDILKNSESDVNTVSVNEVESDVLTDSADSKLIYVSIAGSDSNTGNSTHPYATINKAISTVDDSKDTIIYLGEGTFNDEGNINLEINLANIARGGSLSIIGVDGKTIMDGENSYRAIKSIGLSSIVSLKNIIFNNTESPIYEHGGAIYSQGYLTIDNCLFENSASIYSSGGAIYHTGKNFTLTNSIFKNCHGENEGGAVLVNSQYIEIINNTFINCTGNNIMGAAIYAHSQFTSKINKNKFHNITVSGWSRDASIYSWSDNAEIINNTFENCNNYGTRFAVMYVSGSGYLSGNKFINSSSILKGLIFSNGKMNFIIKINNVSTTSPIFSLTAHITDIDGNSISYEGHPEFFFYLNNENMGRSFIYNSTAKLDLAKLIDNGVYVISAIFVNAINSTWTNGTLTVNINRDPIDLWVDSINGEDVEYAGNETNPFKSISYAINQGLSQSIYPTIHIKNGVYSGENNTNITINDLAIINIIGESVNETIIDGESSNPIFSFISQNTITVMKNISFINAKANSYGGAITSEGSLTVDNCVFKNNAGFDYSGAIYFGKWGADLNLTIANCKFINCTTDLYSASVYTQKSKKIIFENNLIFNCSSKFNIPWNFDYGAVVLRADTVIVSNNQFINNAAIKSFAIDLTVKGTGVIDNNTFINSSADNSRAVLYLEGSANITNNNFFNPISTSVTQYTGVLNIYGNAFLKNNTFTNVTQMGSNIYASGNIHNLKIIILNNQSITINNHYINLTARIMDDNGNLVTVNPDTNKYLYFYIDGENVGRTKDIKDGLATLECYKFLDNGQYSVHATIDIDPNITVFPATLVVNITINPKKYYVSDSLGNDEGGDGSFIKPFKTIKKALNQAYGIDKSYNVTVCVLDGFYSDEGNLNLSLNNSCAGVLKIIGNNYNRSIINGNNSGSFFGQSNNLNQGIPNTLKVIFENITFTNFIHDSRYGSFIDSEASELIFTNCIFNSIYSKYRVIYHLNDLYINNCIFINLISTDQSIIGTYDDTKYYAINNSTFINCKGNVAIIYHVNELNNGKFINCTTYGRNYDEYPIILVKNNMTLLNNIFINNTAVGGVLRLDAPTIVINNTFISNNISYRATINSRTNLTIKDSKLINNKGNMGGVIYTNSHLNLINNIFENNKQAHLLNDIYAIDGAKISGLTLKFNNITSNQYMNDLIANIVSDNGAIITGGKITFYVNDSLVGNANLINNRAFLTYNFDGNDKYIIKGTYDFADENLTCNPGEFIINNYPVQFMDLYVSDSDGNDENGDGSIINPFKSIKKAVYYSVGHDNVTIHILGGIYKDLNNTCILINLTSLTLVGDGVDKTIIDGENVNFFFRITKGSISISNLTLVNGYTSISARYCIFISSISSVLLNNIKYENNSEISVGDFHSMGIVNYGLLTVVGCEFNNNGKNDGRVDSGTINCNSRDSILRIHNSTFRNNTGARSSCIFSLGDVYIYNSTFANLKSWMHINNNGNNPTIIISSRFINNAGISIAGKVYIVNSNFTNNYPTGYYTDGSCIRGSGYVSNCIFINNSAWGSGGAMNFYGEIYNCKFYNNTAASYSSGAGGAIRVGGETTIGNCHFEGNRALAGGGSAMTTGGGAIMNYGNLLVISCTFVDNYAIHRGGAIRNGEGYDNAILTVADSIFINNVAGNNGGAITSYMDPSQWAVVGTIHIYSSKFINNSAGVTGGAIEIFRTNADIDGCLFEKNTALNGGALSISSQTTITNCNFTKNNGFAGGAIRIQGAVDISKSIFLSNNASTGGAIDSVDGSLKLIYSVFVNNTANSLGSAIFEGSANTYITDLSNNWWGINDNPNKFIYSNYTINSWVVVNLMPNLTNITLGDIVDFTVSFSDKYGNALLDLIPTRYVFVNGESYDLTNNTSNFTVSAEEKGIIFISVDNELFNVNINKLLPMINITFSKNPIYGNDIVIYVTLSGSNTIPTGTLIINIDGKNYEVNLTGGKAFVNIGILNASFYEVTVIYNGDENYSNSTKFSHLSVNRARPRFEIHVLDIKYGEVEVINITADRLFNDDVSLLVNGQQYMVSLVNGFGTINLTNLDPNGYVVNTYFTGNHNYLAEDAGPINFYISKADIKVNIIAKDIVVGDVERIVIQTNPKVDGTVNIRLNNDMSSVSLVKGRGSVTYRNLEIGIYEFTVIYKGNTYYNSATDKVTFKVTPDYIVMNSTFFYFFDEEGVLKDNITSSNLTFVGEFSNLGIDRINISKSIDLFGKGAILNDIALIINANNLVLDNFTINISSSCRIDNAIKVMGDNVTIKNCNISVISPIDLDNIAILIENANNFFLIDNTINYVGNSNGNVTNNALYLNNADNAFIKNNSFYISIPSIPVIYNPVTYDSTVLSEGLIIDSSDNVVFSDNIIKVNYNVAFGNYDSIYAIEFKKSDNASIFNNDIGVCGNSYAYGIMMNGNMFDIEFNHVDVLSNNHANGIQISDSSSGVVNKNNINSNAPRVVYPIYSYGNNVKYTNNIINGLSNSVYGMELFSLNETVENNIIIVNGNFTIGVASTSKNLILNNNTIIANGTNKGTPSAGDSIKSETTGVKAIGGNVLIIDNNIISNGENTINVTASGSISNNILKAKIYTGDASINYVPGNVILNNNTPLMMRTILLAEDIIMYYKNGTRYIVKLVDFEGNPLVNQNISIIINGVTYNKTTNEKGTASMAINLVCGNYMISTLFNGFGYYTNSSVDSNLSVLTTIYGNDLVKIFRNKTQYQSTFLDAHGNPLFEGSIVKFNINGVMYERKTNSKGIARLNINLEQGIYIITAINPINGEMHSNNITVLPSITNNSDLVKYYRNKSQYVVSILADDGSVVGAGVEVVFNINGVFYTRQTNAFGQVRLNINLEAGKYIITTIYNSCRVSNNITVLPILSAKDLVKHYGDSDQFIATLLDNRGKANPNQKATFNINGVFYNRVSDSKGQIRLNIRLIPGEYIITSSFNGCNIANMVRVIP